MKSQTKKRVVKKNKKPATNSYADPTIKWNLRTALTATVLVLASAAIIYLYGTVVGSGPITVEEYADKLATCDKGSYVIEMPDLTGGTTDTPAAIKGLKEGTCSAVTELPNNGLLTCNFKESELAQVANDYKASMTGTTSVRATTGLDGSSVESNNPLQRYYDDGTCKVTGY